MSGVLSYNTCPDHVLTSPMSSLLTSSRLKFKPDATSPFSHRYCMHLLLKLLATHNGRYFYSCAETIRPNPQHTTMFINAVVTRVFASDQSMSKVIRLQVPALDSWSQM